MSMRFIWESPQEAPVHFPNIWHPGKRLKQYTDTDLLDVRSILLDAAPNTEDNVHLDVLSKLPLMLMDENLPRVCPVQRRRRNSWILSTWRTKRRRVWMEGFSCPKEEMMEKKHENI